MTEQHPITPPSELLKQWEDDWFEEREHADVLLIQAFQAGADQELEACCEWLCIGYADTASRLRAARRPNPPSLKEQALEALDYSLKYDVSTKYDLLRRALEALPDD
jgi:hypothetical protein